MGDNMSDIYKGNIGVKIEIETNLDEGIDYAKLIITKPDKTTIEWECEINESIIYYITKDNDLDISGIFKLQPYVETATFKGRGSYVEMQVRE
jgi:hypothetical protein